MIICLGTAADQFLTIPAENKKYQNLKTKNYKPSTIPLETPKVDLSEEYKVRHPMQEGSYVTSEYGMRCGVEGNKKMDNFNNLGRVITNPKIRTTIS